MMITKGLPNRYTAVQMHLHWGGWDLEASGSEHTVDGIRYMAEVRHFVVLILVYIIIWFQQVYLMYSDLSVKKNEIRNWKMVVY